MKDGERQGVRERIDTMVGNLVKHGERPEKAREIAKRAAIAHEHNQGRRDPNRNRR